MPNSQTLPPQQGPEYARCGACGHIEPEHRPDGGPCLVCDCAAYRPVAAPTDEDFLVAVEEALESALLPSPGVAALERARDAVMGALAPLVAELRRMADEARPDNETGGEAPSWSDTCPHCKRWYTTSEPGAHEDSCPMKPDPSRVAVEAQQPETQADAHPPTVTWEIESPRRGTWASWGTTYDEHDWARQRFEDAIGHVPARRFRLVRATTTYTVEAETLPAAVAQPAVARQADTAGEQQ